MIFPASRLNLSIVILVFCLMLMISPVQASNKSIVLTTGIKSPLVNDKDSEGFVELLAEEVFRRIGVSMKIEIVPSKLSLVTANKGIEDGVVLRIKGIDSVYKNLVRVPEVLMCNEFSAYSTVKIEKISSWKELSKYDVSYVNGWRIFERNVVKAPSVHKADSANVLFKLLKDKRTEIVLYEKWQGLVLAREIGLDNVYINKLPMQRKQMFIYLHKKHKKMIPKAAQALRDIKRDGTYNKLYIKTLGAYVEGKVGIADGREILLGC